MTATISSLPSATLPVDVNALLAISQPTGGTSPPYVSRKILVGNLGFTLGNTAVALQSTVSSIGNLTLSGASVWNGNRIGLQYGGTATDLSATGGPAQVLLQETLGGGITVRTLTAADFGLGATGSGPIVRQIGPTLVTPALGTPASGVLTNCTGLPIGSGVSGLGPNVAAFLSSPTSDNLRTAVPSSSTGTGALVFAGGPVLSGVTLNGTTTIDFAQFGGSGASFPAFDRSTLTIRARRADGLAFASLEALDLISNNAAALVKTSVALNNGAAAATGTLTNAPSAGNPTKWVAIVDNGITRYIPTWT